MRVDSRGRVRFTYNSIRYEVNNKGVLRAYRRGEHTPNSERARLVPVNSLDIIGRSLLRSAIIVSRGANAAY